MPDSAAITFRGVQIDVDYTLTEDVDYGVEGSPSWDEAEINGVQVNGVEIIEMLNQEMIDDIEEALLEKING